MYSHGSEDMGLLRLHSTYRHDLKIYSSDEGRVQMTAAAFARVSRIEMHLIIYKPPSGIARSGRRFDTDSCEPGPQR